MGNFDAIVMLGTQPDPKTWDFPEQIYDCLKKCERLIARGEAPCVIVSGKWSISLENRGLKQPFTECDSLADILHDLGVDDSKILRESESMDTPSNLYYLKTKIFIPRNMKRILFVVADFRVARLKFLCKRILGPDYFVDFDTIQCDPGPTYNESNTWKAQEEFLKPMKDGEHTYLADKFFTAPIYDYWRQHDLEKYKIEETSK